MSQEEEEKTKSVVTLSTSLVIDFKAVVPEMVIGLFALDTPSVKLKFSNTNAESFGEKVMFTFPSHVEIIEHPTVPPEE